MDKTILLLFKPKTSESLGCKTKSFNNKTLIQHYSYQLVKYIDKEQ